MEDDFKSPQGVCVRGSHSFVGIVALRARLHTLRLRVGSDHRLIFRLHPAALEVVELINRRDLDRWVKGL